jgi:hypothetical protein
VTRRPSTAMPWNPRHRGRVSRAHALGHVRRHVPFRPKKGLFREAEAAFQRSAGPVHAFIDRLKHAPIRDPDFERLLVGAARRGVVAWSALRLVDAESLESSRAAQC